MSPGARRRRALVLGATGTVGQRLVARLLQHPWFELVGVAGSERSAGKPYGEVTRWLEEHPLPPETAARTVLPAEPSLALALLPDGVDVIFSALDADAARSLEPAWVAAGTPVFSNASAFRADPQTPLLVPEVNGAHLDLVADRADRGQGYVVCNPNCSVTGLVLALKPLQDAFGLAAVQVTTMQALSGAGYPGVPSLDALGNVIPWIAGEDEKIEREPKKILGALVGSEIVELPVRISAQANRVPVVDGHLLSVSVALGEKASSPSATSVRSPRSRASQPPRLGFFMSTSTTRTRNRASTLRVARA
jgi:aspartate-semialdehyde dehydrogenase